MPEEGKERTSRLVKSGGVKTSFSKALGQGRAGIRRDAADTRRPKMAVRSLLTMATKPSHSPRTPAGSRYVSTNPILVSTAGPMSLTQCSCEVLKALSEPVPKEVA